MTVKQVLIWVKNHFVLSRQDYQWIHEPCLYGWKEGAAHYFLDDRSQKTAVEYPENLEEMKKEELIELLKDILSVPTSIIRENRPMSSVQHPTMKPVKLLARLICNSARHGEIVLDPFLGSGSTLLACEQTGRTCRGIELDPHYCDVIVQRWEEITGEKAQLVRST